MTLQAARNWLGLYFLVASATIGAYLLMFPGPYLPMAPEDASDAFRVIIPVLVGQLTVVFQWFASRQGDEGESKETVPFPAWTIKAPPLVALGIVGLAAFTLWLASRPGSTLAMSSATFKGAVTFAVTILNASTVYLVARLFPAKGGD